MIIKNLYTKYMTMLENKFMETERETKELPIGN